MNQVYRHVLDTVAQQRVPDETNLFPRIAANLERKTILQTLRARPVLMILVVLVALSLLSGVVYAVGRSLGYIPGVGIIEQGVPMRVLSAPVSVERDGIVLTVTEAVLTSDKSVVLFTIDNVPWDAFSHDETVIGCPGAAELRLPNGTKLHVLEGGGGMGEIRYVYAPIPADINEATFVLPCIMNTLPGLAPENWELRLGFVPAPPDMTVIPVVEVVPTADPTASLDEPLTLTNAISVGEQIILLGSIQQPDDGGWVELGAIRLMDANGQAVGTSFPALDGLPTFDWGVQFKSGGRAFPVTLALDWVRIVPVKDAHAEFEFDAGENPQTGRAWELDLPIQIGGRTVTLTTVRVDSRGGYRFEFAGDPDVAGLSLEIDGYSPLGGGGGRGWGGEFSAGVMYPELPNGKLRVLLSNLMIASPPETWTIEWMPEDSLFVETPASASANEACLTFEMWNQLVEQTEPPPAGLGGKILTTVSEGDILPAIYIGNLDGTNLRKVDNGVWPALSNDGKYLAYSAADGLRVIDLSSGQSSLLGTDGYEIVWSPDNTRMMFTNIFNLFVINADGTGLQTVDTGPAQVISPIGWLTDNQTVVYGMLSGGGFDLKSHNRQSGETEALFTIRNKAGFGAISPDGQWIVFADRESMTGNWGVFISHLDGSARKLVAEPEVPTAFTTVWGPDSQWLTLNTLAADGERVPVLVNPFTCQAVRLNASGMVEGWSP